MTTAPWFISTHTRAIRDQLIFHAEAGELVRVFLRGRRNLRAAVCFVGAPVLRGKAVTLLGTDNVPRATVPLRNIAAVQRVVARPIRDTEPAPAPVELPVPAGRAVIRADLVLDISKALEQVEYVRTKVDEAMDRDHT